MVARPRLETVPVKTAVEGKCRIIIETSFAFLEDEKKRRERDYILRILIFFTT